LHVSWSWRSGRRVLAWPFLPETLFVLLVLAVYADPLFLHRSFAGRDLVAYNLPMEKVIHDAYARRRLPVWMAEISGGRPLLPNPNVGALYPVRPLLAPLPFALAMRVYPVLHWVAAGVGMILLLRLIGVSRSGAWLGAVTYGFSGVVVSEVFFPHIQPGAALLPWILWQTQRTASGGTGRVVGLSLLLALDLLAADVFTVLLAVLGAFFWILLEGPAGDRPRALLRLGLALGLAGLLAAPQIVATALWIPETQRAVTGMKLEDSLLYSLSPLRLLELVVPYPFGATWTADPSLLWTTAVFHRKTGGLFVTLYAGAFAVIGAAAAVRGRFRGARFARVFLLLALAASVLPSLVPRRFEKLSSPVALRNPEKLAVAIVFALALLAAWGFEGFRRFPRLSAWTLRVAVVLCFLAVLSAFLPAVTGSAALRLAGTGPSSNLASRAGRQLAGAFAEAGLFWTASLLALDALGARRRAGLPAAILILTACPILSNRRIAQTVREDEIFPPTAFARFLARADPGGAYRTLGESIYLTSSPLEAFFSRADPHYNDFPRRTWYEHTQALWSRGTVFNMDFDRGDLSRVESLRQVALRAARFSGSENFFGSLALRWGIRFRDERPLPGYLPIGGDALQIWDEQARAFPDLRLVTRWTEEKSAVSALMSLPRLSAGEIVVETGVRRQAAAREGELRLLEKSPEHLSLEVSAPEPTWLFVLRAYWSYRTVLLDGRETQTYPAQLAFSAMPIPEGRHRIDWKEEVPGGEISRWGPAVFLLIVVSLLVSSRRGMARSAAAS
jgi:hypothetical protein